MNYERLNNLTNQFDRIKNDMSLRRVHHHNTWNLWGSLWDMSDSYKDMIDIEDEDGI
jgi:hypothetical protein